MEKRPAPRPEDETMLTAACAGEMTGLLPAGRPDSAERASYRDLFPWLPPETAPQI